MDGSDVFFVLNMRYFRYLLFFIFNVLFIILFINLPCDIEIFFEEFIFLTEYFSRIVNNLPKQKF